MTYGNRMLTMKTLRAGAVVAAAALAAGTAGPAAADGGVRWPAPSDPSAGARRAGLPMLSTEGTVLHHHAHLDVRVHGRAVTVPAGIGIDEARHRVSPLHTHDASGVIHLESPVRRTFTLGQFFTEWGVPLSRTRLGGLRADARHTLGVYVNGRRVTGDPAAVPLRQHDEVAVTYGRAGRTPHVPASYRFAPGL